MERLVSLLSYTSVDFVIYFVKHLLFCQNRNSICGKHKQELLCQLREMAKMEPNFSGCLEDLDLVGFQSESPGKCQWMDSSLCPENDCKPIPIPSFEVVYMPHF